MTVLGFDTATPLTAVCLMLPSGDLFESGAVDSSIERQPQHSRELLPEIVRLLEVACCSWSDVDELAVGVGPGTYTGVRIGVATARALSQSLDLPLKPVSTLAALALGIAEEQERPDVLLPMINARRGQIFACAYKENGGFVEQIIDEFVSYPNEIHEHLAGLDPELCLSAGDGALGYKKELIEAGVSVLPDSNVAHLLKGRFICRMSQGIDPVELEKVTPTYLRLPDAELTLREGKLNI